MELLSDNLKKELIMEINGTILNRFYIFSYIGFTDKLIRKIACLMKERIYGNEEIILNVTLCLFHIRLFLLLGRK